MSDFITIQMSNVDILFLVRFVYNKRIEDRIVSISQPHVRPIVRGKAGKLVEFGAKVSVSLVDGYSFIERMSWDNFNESKDLSTIIVAINARIIGINNHPYDPKGNTMQMKIESLSKFYELMWYTVHIRRQIVKCLLNKERIEEKCVDSLKTTLAVLESLPKENGKYKLSLREGKSIHTELTYEIDELRKDLFYLEHSEDMFYQYLERMNPGFFSELEKGLRFFSGAQFKNFITDRDGTVNNYCGRYKSAVQSIYNSVFLVRFARECALNSVILTSAPLENFGLLDVSVDPGGIFIYAGSKGREYIDKSGRRGGFPVKTAQQQNLDTLNKRLSELLKREEYEQFSLIGSGLQFKFGQTTVARQDIYGTIEKQESEKFLQLVTGIVREVDPENKFFRIEDTGKDIEIVLTMQRSRGTNDISDFNKGDGVEFLNRALNLRIEGATNLICGDTSSDIPMVKASLEKSSHTSAIFVTEDEDLKGEVCTVCPNAFFVSKSDILVSILYGLSKAEEV